MTWALYSLMTGSRGASWGESGMRHLRSGASSCALTFPDQEESQARPGSHSHGLEVRSRLARLGSEAGGRTEAGSRRSWLCERSRWVSLDKGENETEMAVSLLWARLRLVSPPSLVRAGSTDVRLLWERSRTSSDLGNEMINNDLSINKPRKIYIFHSCTDIKRTMNTNF